MTDHRTPTPEAAAEHARRDALPEPSDYDPADPPVPHLTGPVPYAAAPDPFGLCPCRSGRIAGECHDRWPGQFVAATKARRDAS